MAIRFYCPLGHRLRVPDARAGKKGRCPICYQRVIVPVADPRPSGKQKKVPVLRAQSDDPADLEMVLEDTLGLDPFADNDDETAASDDRDSGTPGKSASAGASPLDLLPPRAAVSSVPIPLTDPAAPQPTPTPTQPQATQPPPTLPPATSTPTTPASHSAHAPASPTSGSPPIGASSLGNDNRGVLPAVAAVRRQRAWFAPANTTNYPTATIVSPELRRTTGWLAASLALVSLLSLIPVGMNLRSSPLPPWAPLLLFGMWLGLAAALWLVLVPDWSSLLSTALFASVITLAYIAVMLLVLSSPRGQSLWLDLHKLRNTLGAWCAGCALCYGTLGYALGWTAIRWRSGQRFR